jgi:hypothetical protein
VEDLEKTKTATEKKKGKVDLREKIPGAIFITANDEWTVYQITTNEASSKLGQGTEWCIKHESSHYWQEYSRKNNIYFLISKTRDSKDPWFKIALLKDMQGQVTVWDSLDQKHSSLPDDLKIPSFEMEVFTFKWQADEKGNVNASGLGLTSLSEHRISSRVIFIAVTTNSFLSTEDQERWAAFLNVLAID